MTGSNTSDEFQIESTSATEFVENLKNNSDEEIEEWVEISNRVKLWDKIVYQRILKRCNPAEKKILKLLKEIDSDNQSTWIDFEGKEFKRLIQASFEYDEKRKN